MRKTILALFAIILSFHTASAQVMNNDSVPSRKKVAVVLSGGGALGAIHVGALKVLEQAGMPIDMVVGTSMGSIVGALYSVGYNSNDIATMFRNMDWAELFLDRNNYHRLTLSERETQNTYIYDHEFYVHGAIDPQPGGMIRGTQIESTFEHYLQGYTDSIDFLRDLPRKFACVATDLVTDSAIVFTRGSLVKSIRSSMSIPGVFTPVHLDEMVLVDGGVKNNFPADVARQLGADIVIGVKFDLGLGTDKEYRTLMDVMERSAGSDVSRRARENEKYCDLLVKVPVRGYTSGSFSGGALNDLMSRGEKAMAEKMDSIKLLKLEAGARVNHDYTLHLRNADSVDLAADTTKELMDIRKDNTILASVGLRFDSDDLIAAQLRGRWFLGGTTRKELDLTLRLGLRSMVRLDFDIEPRKFRKMGFSYEFWYNKNCDYYLDGKRYNTPSFIYQHADIKLLTMELKNFDFNIGLGWEHRHFNSSHWNGEAPIEIPRNESFFNYHAKFRYDNEDNHYFARRGVRAEAQYAFYTDNLAQWKNHTGFSSVMAMCRVTIPLSHSTHLRPCLQGRLLMGDDLPMTARNIAGGPTYGKYFPQQLPLTGLVHAELMGNKFLSASLRLQQRITGKHYILLDGSVAEQDDNFSDLFSHHPLWGAGLSYFYNSGIAGPLGATLCWSSHTRKVYFYVSLGFDF